LIEYFLKAWQGPGREVRLGRKPCTVLVQGKHRRDITCHNPIAELPQSAAGAGRKNFAEIAEHPRHP